MFIPCTLKAAKNRGERRKFGAPCTIALWWSRTQYMRITKERELTVSWERERKTMNRRAKKACGNEHHRLEAFSTAFPSNGQDYHYFALQSDSTNESIQAIHFRIGTFLSFTITICQFEVCLLCFFEARKSCLKLLKGWIQSSVFGSNPLPLSSPPSFPLFSETIENETFRVHSTTPRTFLSIGSVFLLWSPSLLVSIVYALFHLSALFLCFTAL